MDLSKLTIVTSLHLSDDEWKGIIRKIEFIQPGDIIEVGQEKFKVVGEKDGRIECVSEKWGGCTVDPMIIK